MYGDLSIDENIAFFAEIHGVPIRLGVIEKYRFGKVARAEQIFSVDPRMGIVFHKAALQG